MPSQTENPEIAATPASHDPSRGALEPMDPQLTSIQPGGGVVIGIELGWGRFRRWYLKKFRPRYVARLRETRKGDFNGAPHEVLDPRDLKFFRNQGGYYWDERDDPFLWRDRLPFARVGLAELLLLAGGAFALGFVFGLIATNTSLPRPVAALCGFLAAAFAVIGLLITWFFRNPDREIPADTRTVVAPADGTVVTVEDVLDDDFVPGPAVKIGIFLSIFNVHINRMPVEARVIGLRYKRGKMLNALRPESARENEQLAVRIESDFPPFRRMVVRQITGQFARRIVCWLKPGDRLGAGEQFGMIKLGSRTELILPRDEGLEITVRKGDKVNAGSSVVARYRPVATPARGVGDAL
jgi:phosphatidylserine decarboxylase